MENKEYIKSIGQAYQQVQEKLKGDQHKLDKDKDGDIDGSDLAAMRKKDNQVDCPECKGEGCDHCDGKGYHKKTDEQGACSSDRKTRKEDEEVVMNPKKKKEKGEKAMSSDSNMAQEDTKWPIYKRIVEKNVVNQNAVPPEQMIPADKNLKDDQADTVNQSQDHISAAAANWIKDHEGNQVPADSVDHEKIVAKNAQDLMRTVPNQAKDEVNKKAVKPETMKKVEDK